MALISAPGGRRRTACGRCAAAGADRADARSRSPGRCSPTKAGGTPAGCSPTAPSSAARSRSCGSPGALAGGPRRPRARLGGRVRLRAADEDLPGLAGRARTHYARLQEPFGYWNAVGLTAAMGAIGCMWLGARRTGHALLSALAYPALGLLLLTLLLAYSRGALVALAVGLVLWFAIVPLRLRGAAVLIAGGRRPRRSPGVGLHDARPERRSRRARAAHDRRAPARRAGARDGRSCSPCAGVAIGFVTDRRAPSALARRRAGGDVLLALMALAVLRLRGRAGAQPAGPHGQHLPRLQRAHRPERQTAAQHARAADGGGERAGALLEGGAAGLRSASRRSARARKATRPRGCATAPRRSSRATRTASSCRRSPTSGSWGCCSRSRCCSRWMAAAGRATHPFNRRWGAGASGCARSGGRPGWRSSPQPYSPERIGMLSMLCLVVVFGVHSLDRLDLVRAGGRVRGAAVRRLAGGPRRAAPAEPRAARADRASSARSGARRPSRTADRAGVRARSSRRCWRPGRSGSRSAPKKRARRRWRCSQADPAGRRCAPPTARSRATRCRSKRCSRWRASSRRPAARRSRAPPCSRPCACSRRTRRPGSNSAATTSRRTPARALHELQAAIYLNPESIAPEALGRATSAKRSKSTTTTSKRSAARHGAVRSASASRRTQQDAGVRRAARRRG